MRKQTYGDWSGNLLGLARQGRESVAWGLLGEDAHTQCICTIHMYIGLPLTYMYRLLISGLECVRCRL